MTSASRILLVDDDAELCVLLAEYLTRRGFEVKIEGDGARGLEKAQIGEYALLLLDAMLPSLDGLEVLRRLRANACKTLPVIMLTAHGDETDRIVGLELGADDYLPKPFNPRELLARIRAVLRRANPADESIMMDESIWPAPTSLRHAGPLEINLDARSVRRNGERVDLTAIEFDLLRVLLEEIGKVVTREDLARNALARRLLPLDRSLDMHVSKLRHRLWPDGKGMEHLKTVRGVGYILVKDEG